MTGPARGSAPRRPVLFASACGGAFALLTAAVAVHGWTAFGFEAAAVRWGVTHRPPTARALAIAVTALGTYVFPYLLALAAGAVSVRSRRPAGSRRRAVVLLAPAAWLAAGQVLRQALMHGLARPRPPAAGWAFDASAFSFPSGHAFTSALSAGLLAVAVARARPSATRAATTAAVLFAAVIGFTRVYLGVHWPLDVLGGWLLAGCWLALGVCLLPKLPAGPGAPN
ncbi:phosphatase PAP2 family protein [Kitasatospora sp. NA04385]|uniref:phosphatase PAP2 family protein n=1 Tax=Kitasatospora sp. NA04385 TaxID=2742135 RepID=UPI0015907F00|nr:phosphatase PAP2 family protein [Kitasatospora sp. NA04385]QKW18026.1 phosphatase PAP2 family protein [Kitasatospora sp. NA04385]